MTYDWICGRTCPICGKEFFPTSDWVYRSGGRQVCSWSCELRGRKPDMRRLNKREKAVEMLNRDGVLIRCFISASEAAKCMGFSPDAIRASCRTSGSCYRGYLWRYKEGTK